MFGLQGIKNSKNTQTKVDRDYSPPAEVCLQNMQKACDLLVELDPRCRKVLETLSEAGNQKMKLELVRDAADAAKKFGETGYTGDAFTISVLKPNKITGKVDLEMHISYIEGRAVNTLGRALITLQHELYHIDRAHNRTTNSNRKLEERQTFQESYQAAQKLVTQFERLAKKNPKDADFYRRVANEVKDCLPYEKKYLDFWKK
jgi:hypothetical protein